MKAFAISVHRKSEFQQGKTGLGFKSFEDDSRFVGMKVDLLEATSRVVKVDGKGQEKKEGRKILKRVRRPEQSPFNPAQLDRVATFGEGTEARAKT